MTQATARLGIIVIAMIVGAIVWTVPCLALIKIALSGLLLAYIASAFVKEDEL